MYIVPDISSPRRIRLGTTRGPASPAEREGSRDPGTKDLRQRQRKTRKIARASLSSPLSPPLSLFLSLSTLCQPSARRNSRNARNEETRIGLPVPLPSQYLSLEKYRNPLPGYPLPAMPSRLRRVTMRTYHLRLLTGCYVRAARHRRLRNCIVRCIYTYVVRAAERSLARSLARTVIVVDVVVVTDVVLVVVAVVLVVLVAVLASDRDSIAKARTANWSFA